jgi:hypothetical protein
MRYLELFFVYFCTRFIENNNLKNNNLQTLTKQQIQGKLKYYCAYQERCYKEVEEKLYSYAATVSEKEAATLLSQMESSEEELHQLRKKFISNLKSVIPAVKILKLKKAEEDFNRKLLQQYRNKRNR